MANNSVAYDLSLFEEPRTKPVTKKPQPKKKRKKHKKVLRFVKKRLRFIDNLNVSTTVNRKAEVIGLNKKAIIQIAVPVALCMVLLPVFLLMKSATYELDSQIADLEAQIEIQEGESVRLKAELSSMFSYSEIEAYAEEHGMVKVDSYQISYIDLSEGDKIVVSGDRDPDELSNLALKIKNLVVGIFD